MVIIKFNDQSCVGGDDAGGGGAGGGGLKCDKKNVLSKHFSFPKVFDPLD